MLEQMEMGRTTTYGCSYYCQRRTKEQYVHNTAKQSRMQMLL